MTETASSRRALLRALLDPSPEVAAAAGRQWLDSVDIQLIGYDQARMLPMFYKRMHELGVEQPPLVRGTYRKAWVQNQLRFRAAAQFLDRLRSAGVPSLVLKGASLVPAYGGDWGLRDMSDVDALIKPEHLERALCLLEEEGWHGMRGVSGRSVVTRLAHRRHSWNFEHPEGHQVDLHWHVFASSRGEGAEASFWSAAVPLHLGPTSAMRFCDGDLLLHVLEHASHDEENSRVQWAVDAVQLLRATPDVRAVAQRTADQAASHDLVPIVAERLGVLADVAAEPRVTQVLDAVRRARVRHRRLVVEHRRGGVPFPRAVRSMAVERLDAGLARSPAAWSIYVATGRRSFVERAVRRITGPLATTVGPATAPGADGWWDLDNGATLDALCGPGWSYPDPVHGTWSEGTEARLLVPCRGSTTLDVELQVLARYGGPPREVAVRVAGRTMHVLSAPEQPDGIHTLTMALPPDDVAEVAFLIRHPARPVDLGINPDPRSLGVVIHRIRVR